MPTYQIGNSTFQSDSELSNEDLNKLSGGGENTPSLDSESTFDASDNASMDSSTNNSIKESAIQKQIQSPQDKAVNMVGQFGKSIYTNPLAHPLLKILSDAAGANADEVYNNIPEPQGVMEKVASGAGAAVPLVLATMPIGRAINATLDVAANTSSSIPVLGKLTSMLKSSDLAKSALTGLGYGAAEANAINANGGNVDVSDYAKNTAGQFLLWGAMTRGGATLASRFLPKDLPMAEQIISKMPDALKKAYTPEGLGSIAGGMAAGAMNAPDKKSGIAGAVIGGAMSAMSPSEQFQFRQGMGKSEGFGLVRGVTNGWGPQYSKSIDVIEKNGFDSTMSTGIVSPEVQQQLELQPNETTAHVVAKTMLNGLDEMQTNLKEAAKPILQKMENTTTSQEDSRSISLVDKVTRLINSRINTPLIASSLKTAWQNSLKNMQAVDIDSKAAKYLKLAPEDFQGKIFRMPVNEIHNIDDPKVREALFKDAFSQQVKSAGNKKSAMDMPPEGGISPEKSQGITNVSIESLDNARQAIRRVAYSGSGDAQEQATAKQIYGLLSEHLKSIGYKKGTVTPYSRLMKGYSDMYDLEDKIGETKDYRKLAEKLANPHWASDDPTRAINTENNLKEIDSDFEKYGLSNYKTKNLLDRYHAYRVFNDPTMESFAKNYLARHVSSTLTTAALGAMTGGGNPLAALAGGIAGYSMGNPKAWIPVLKGADLAKRSIKK